MSHIIIRNILMGVLCCISVSCSSLSHTAADVFGSTDEISDTKTVSGELFLDGTVVIENGGTLIIEPGSVVHCKNNSRIIVNGSLIAEGTKENPIVFKNENGGQWRGIRFEYATEKDASHLTNVELICETTFFKVHEYDQLETDNITFFGKHKSSTHGSKNSQQISCLETGGAACIAVLLIGALL